jgi:hypothetical protein
MEYATLEDSHIETPVLRQHAPGAKCAVVAAYKGATMKYLLSHGATFVAGVEPQPWAYDQAVKNLSDSDFGDDDYSLDCAALVPWETEPNGNSRVNRVKLYNIGTDAATILSSKAWLNLDDTEVVALNIGDWLNAVEDIDFMVMNCEGAEYMLFMFLAATVTRVLVQFHGPPIPVDSSGYAARTEIGSGWFLYE